MAKTQEVPTIIRPFNKVFERLAYRHYANEVFDDFLTYFIHVFTENREDTDIDWIKNRYGSDYQILPELFREFMLGMEEATKTHEWYDFLGLYYEIITSRWKSSNMGQFFTPMAICDLMSCMTGDTEPVRGKRVMDCACGSGRTLISFHVRNLGNRYYANDLDAMAAKMCIVNFLVHGMVGQVTCANALDPRDFRWGYSVNHRLYPFGMVSCRKITREQSEVHTFWDDTAESVQNNRQQESTETSVIDPVIAKSQQLTFF